MPTELFTFRNADCELYTVTDSIDSEQYFVLVEDTKEITPAIVTRDSLSIETVSIDSTYTIDTDMLVAVLQQTVVNYDPYMKFTADSYSVSHSPEKTIISLAGEVIFDDDTLPTTIVLRLE